MQPLSCQEIREKWIEFFSKKCERTHLHIPSASLVPDNPTLLLNSAGMVQFVPIFMGIKAAPNPPRAITIQKCARVGGKDSDLENIGRTPRHHSFFEMLGNFSFGDYFKKEAITWAWKFTTEELGLPAEKLYISVFEGDEYNAFDKEAFDIWMQVLAKDFPDTNEREKRIWKLTRKDNFWGPPGKSGPCGPCSEIYFDLSDEALAKDDRYVEIWNLVFMEFNKDEEGNYSPLASKNIDTGAGLERIATILQGVNNSFETDELYQILDLISKTVNNEIKDDNTKTIKENFRQLDSFTIRDEIAYKPDAKYGSNDWEINRKLKIISDHLRCVVFLIADGVRPSNVGRGYVLRMLIRRASRFLYILRGWKADPKLYTFVTKVSEIYSKIYPEINQVEIISQICKKEEEQFLKTIINGEQKLISKIHSLPPSSTIDGEFVFDLYSTYGFPFELTKEIIEERGAIIDEKGYKKAQEKHSEVSSTGAFDTSVFANTVATEILKSHGPTKFLGYDLLESPAQILAIINQDGNRVDDIELGKDDFCNLILDQTTFYAESGGQVSDQGTIKTKTNSFEVIAIKKSEGIFLHKITGTGMLQTGDKVTCTVDPKTRRLTKLHHTLCHLLQAALRKVAGKQIQQMGSQVGPEYTRFDFNFDRALTKEELSKIEEQINFWIKKKLPATTKVMAFDEAVKAGALSFFEEKYEDEVRVLFVGDDNEMASIELCGGTHTANTSEIESIAIASEGSVAAGVRRIKLHAAELADEFIKDKEKQEAEKSALEAEKQKQAELEKARKNEITKDALSKIDGLISKAETREDVKVLILNINEFFSEGLEGEILKTLAEALIDKFKASGSKAFVFMASAQNDKAIFVAAAAEELVKDKNSIYNASNAVKLAAQICGGNGGGRPNFAQAGGKDVSKIPEAIQAIAAQLRHCEKSTKL